MSNENEVMRDLKDHDNIGKVVLRGICPFCEDRVTFKQVTPLTLSRKNGYMVPILCEGCFAIAIYSASENKIYPTPKIKGVEGLPKEIDTYYQEALRCISADSPNGAVTLFRKTIHAIGIHYNIATKNDTQNLYGIIKKLKDDGHISEKIKLAFDEIRSIGNDGAHVNENEPDEEQALLLKSLMDKTLNLTILYDQDLKTAKEKRKGNK